MTDTLERAEPTDDVKPPLLVAEDLVKDFPIRGTHKMQLRWEIYNLFNHPQWATINTAAQFNAAGEQTNRAFGTALTARTERRMQVSLRYQF